MKKIIKIILIIILTLPLAFLLLVPLANNYSAAKVANRLKNIPLPEKTEYIDSVSAAGKLIGNGNGMEYLGAILIQSELSEDDLNQYYAEEDGDCWVSAQKGKYIDFIEHGTVFFSGDMLPDKQYYIVCAWGEGIEPFTMFDLRGH